MFKTLARYEEADLGLPYSITLIDSAEQEIDDHTGEPIGISVPDLEQLAIAVAIVRVLAPVQLAGAEVRFIRRVLGMTATALAEEISLEKATFSRWENGKQEVGEWADKQVRHIAVIKLAPLVPCLSLDPSAVIGLRIRKADPGVWPQIQMRRVPTSSLAPCSQEGSAWDTMPLALAA